MAQLFTPLARLDQATAQYLWFGLNCAALAGFVALAIGLSGSRLARECWATVLLGFCISPPTRLSLQLGQVSIMIALLLALSWRWERRPPLGGAALALAGLIKLYPGLMGLAYLILGPRRLALWALGLVGAALAAGLALDPGPYITCIEKVLLGGFYPYAAEFNISLVGFWRRLLTESRYAIPVASAPGLAQLLIAGSSALLLACCLLASAPARRGGASGQRDDPERRRLQLSLWLCAMLLLAPVNGVYNLTLLLPPLLALLRHLELRPSAPMRNWLLLATLLICVPPGWEGSARRPTSSRGSAGASCCSPRSCTGCCSTSGCCSPRCGA